MNDISYAEVASKEKAKKRTKNDHSNAEGRENTRRDPVTHMNGESSPRRDIKSGTQLAEQRSKQVKRRKLSEAKEHQNT